jgi:sec-independent protein translocase protein TatA
MLAWALGGWDMVIIVLVILLLFGAKRIPELAKGLGTGIKEFKKATKEVTDEIHNAAEEKPAAPQKPVADSQTQSGQTVSQSTNPPKA